MSSTSQDRQAFAAVADSSFASSGTGDWQPSDIAEFAADLQQSHPHYRVTSFVQKGGMGAVYRALDTRSGTVLAIKMMRPDFLTDARDVARFQRESTILGRLQHPHIISLLDHGETPRGNHFLVMPWLGERTLAHYTTGPKMPTQRVLQLMQQLCAGMAHAHENGIIHRDLKPSNILLADPDERAVILDFGIARACVPVDDLGTLSRPGDRPGTYGYMSPSRLAGQEAVQADDIYSLAAIFYQLITGQLLQGYPRPLSEFDQGLDARFDAILAKALHAEPTQRYKDAKEFAEAIATAANVMTSKSNASITREETSKQVEIEIEDYLITINGLDFTFYATIDQVVEALGPYSRFNTVMTGRYKTHPQHSDEVFGIIYLWDELGISVYVQVMWFATPSVLRFDLNFNALSRAHLPESDDSQILRDTAFRCSYPKSEFKGTLSLNGKRISEADNHHSILDTRGSNHRTATYLQDGSEPIFALLSPGYKFLPTDNDRKDWLSNQIQSEHLKESIVKIGTFHISNIEKPFAVFSFWPISVPHSFENSRLNAPGIDLGSCVGSITKNTNTELPLEKNEYVLMAAPGASFSAKGDNGYYLPTGIFHTHFILTNRRVLARCTEDYKWEKWGWNKSFRISEFPKCERFHTKSQGLESMQHHNDKLGRATPSLSLFLYGLFSSKKKSNEKLALYAQIRTNRGERSEFRTRFTADSVDPDDMMQMEFAKQQISFLFHCAGVLACDLSKRRFPNYAFAPSTRDSQALDQKNNSLHPCPTCGKEIAKSARACPHCGEHLRSGRKPSGWRQKACSNCGEVMSRFAEKCQQPDCGHPNTWLKLQTMIATLAVLAGGVWSVLHFQQHQLQGLLLPALLTAAALTWRLALGLLKSFYSH